MPKKKDKKIIARQKAIDKKMGMPKGKGTMMVRGY